MEDALLITLLFITVWMVVIYALVGIPLVGATHMIRNVADMVEYVDVCNNIGIGVVGG